VEVVDSGDGGRELWFEVDEGLERYLVDKGSITVDGVSLTVVRPEAGRFGVALIPLTLELTTLSGLAVGDRVNLEADMIGKWVERLMPPR
jgi:riboflavin synthase